MSVVVLYLGLLVLAIDHNIKSNSYIDSCLILSIIPLSFLIALAWPYYPLLKLMLLDGSLYDGQNSPMYQGVLKIIYPALLGLPLLFLRIRSNWKDPLGLFFGGLVMVYALGGITHHFTYGRVIPFIVLILHMSLADWLCKNEKFKLLTVKSKCFFITIVLVSLIGIFNNCNKYCLAYMPGFKNNYVQFLFLKKYTKQYDVILSDQRTSYFIPSFGGKVIANDYPLAFVKDYETRKKDIDRFFNKGTSISDREDIIKKYNVNFILINKTRPTDTSFSLDDLDLLGRQIYVDKDFILIKIKLKNLLIIDDKNVNLLQS